VSDARNEPTADWDDHTVRAPGGHALQGTAWAEHRRSQGWRSRFVRFSDGRAALVLTHRQPPLPGFVAYAPRGPIAAGDGPERTAERAAALVEWLRPLGATILAVDPELDADSAYDRRLAATGFRPTEEIQPSRHRMVLPLPPGTTEESLLAGFAKTTRQRIRAAEKAGTSVREAEGDADLAALERFLDATAERKGFNFGADRGFLDWWRRAVGAGVAYAVTAENGGRVVGGLVAYLQGGHHATAFSADDASLRREIPGTMHLIRWHVIRRALEDGAPSVDLGGVDVAGHRDRPEPGDPSWGMYEHKASFGAQWVSSTAAHEIVLRPGVYRAGLVARTARRGVRSALRRVRPR
jgi:lipid II:glycine glycyltransferase (peptidoglycan interpeptide bridge formation enzyme)